MEELIQKLEKLEGPDRDVDMAICLKLDTGRRIDTSGRSPKWLGPDHFTASLDAALTLVPEEWILLNLSEIGADGLPLAVLGNPGLQPSVEVSGIPFGARGRYEQLTIALCIAALKARAHKGGEG